MTAASIKLIPDREALAQFADLMFRRADPTGYISLRAFPDKSEQGKKKEKAIFIEAIQIGDAAFLDIVFERARQAAAYPVPGRVLPANCELQTSAERQTANNLHEGVALSVECDEDRQAALATAGSLAWHRDRRDRQRAASGWTRQTGEIEPKGHLHWRLMQAGRDRGGARIAARGARAGRQAGRCRLERRPDRAPAALARVVASQEARRGWPGSLPRPRTRSTSTRRSSCCATRSAPRLRRDQVQNPASCGADDHAAVAAALAVIPNNDLKWVDWNRVGMAAWAATDGSDIGRAAFAAWSAKSAKNDKEATEARWQHYATSPPTRIGFGTLVYLARKHAPGWRYGRAADASGPRLDPEDVDIVGGGKSGGHREIPEPPRYVDGRPTALFGPLSKMADRAEHPAGGQGAVLSARRQAGAARHPAGRNVPRQDHQRGATRRGRYPLFARHAVPEVAVGEARQALADMGGHPSAAEAAMILLKRFGDWKFPAIAGIISTPTLRPDGTILSAPGYRSRRRSCCWSIRQRCRRSPSSPPRKTRWRRCSSSRAC